MRLLDEPLRMWDVDAMWFWAKNEKDYVLLDHYFLFNLICIYPKLSNNMHAVFIHWSKMIIIINIYKY